VTLPGVAAALGTATSATSTAPSAAALQRFATEAASIERLQAAVVSHRGEPVLAERFRGPAPERQVNVKSVSKTLVGALTGAALHEGALDSVRRTIGELAPSLIPAGADARVATLAIEDLLTMRAGLERTSGANYGAWVSSADWVSDALERPFVAEPGGRMLYSTGSWHVLGAVLSEITGESLHTLANRWLGEPLGFRFPPWTRDPQGRYMGGNQMVLSPLELARIGALYLNGGTVGTRRVFAADWIDASFTLRTRSPWSGDAYGYGWFLRDLDGVQAAYARGYGGQFMHVVPDRQLVVVLTSDVTRAARGGGYTDRLHGLVARHLL